MNWQLIYQKLLPILIGWGMITGSFYISRYITKYESIKRDKKATTLQKSWGYIRCILVAAVVGGVFSGWMDNVNFFLVYFIPIVLPALWGTIAAYDYDNKLSPGQRLLARTNLEAQERLEAKKDYGEF